ncbi:peptidase [Bacillus phage vB_BceH_LY2]|nr:peptidase [Bacillus phage vB_BceH_LY2]
MLDVSPEFIIKVISGKDEYTLRYDTEKNFKTGSFEEAILNLTVKNAMETDCPVLSMVLSAKKKWDKILAPNDLITVEINPDRTKKKPENPYIFVGLLSSIHKEGEYGDSSLLYRITGQGMMKTLLNFDVGVIQGVAPIVPTIGWLPDGTEGGIKFSGNTASGIGNELMERFIYKHAKYQFDNGKGLTDYLIHEFDSWTEDELLTDPAPFVNYQGSMKQFLEDVTAKPFNELYSDFTKDGRCALRMRKTPFDMENWFKLPRFRITSDIVAQESYGKNDNEMFSVYIVQPPTSLEFSNIELGVFPKFHPELIKKYGYKRLDTHNRYLMSRGIDANQNGNTGGTTPGGTNGGNNGGTTTPPNNGGGTGGMTPASQPRVQKPEDGKEKPKEENSVENAPPFEEVDGFIKDSKLNDPELLRLNRYSVYSTLVSRFPAMTQSLVYGILDSLRDGSFNQSTYDKLVSTSAEKDKRKEPNKEKNVAGDKLEKFTQKIFNWYCENGNFYSGDIRVIGNPEFRIGSRIIYDDFEQDTVWEFYLESTQHEFSFVNGYTTVLGVTRGLPNSGVDRFSHLWGQSEDFKGGYLGEKSLEELIAMSKTANPTNGSDASNPNGGGGNWGGGGGGNVAMSALNTARQMTSRRSVYIFGGGRSGKNPFEGDPIKVDCSSFVWWCYNLHGVQLNGGATGMTTDTIARDPRLQQVTARGSSKENAMAQIREGDIIYFDTYKSDGHVGIYSGNGRFIGSQSTPGIKEEDLNTAYWKKVFNGHVRRFNG